MLGRPTPPFLGPELYWGSAGTQSGAAGTLCWQALPPAASQGPTDGSPGQPSQDASEMCLSAFHVSVCLMYADAGGGQKRALNPLELELPALDFGPDPELCSPGTRNTLTTEPLHFHGAGNPGSPCPV